MQPTSVQDFRLRASELVLFSCAIWEARHNPFIRKRQAILLAQTRCANFPAIVRRVGRLRWYMVCTECYNTEATRERSSLTVFDSSQAQLLRSFLNPRRIEAHLGNSSAVHSSESWLSVLLGLHLISLPAGNLGTCWAMLVPNHLEAQQFPLSIKIGTNPFSIFQIHEHA